MRIDIDVVPSSHTARVSRVGPQRNVHTPRLLHERSYQSIDVSTVLNETDPREQFVTIHENSFERHLRLITPMHANDIFKQIRSYACTDSEALT